MFYSKNHIRNQFIFFGPFIFLAMAFIVIPIDNDKPVKTTPYKFSIPLYLKGPINPRDNPTTIEGVALGRKLFYDSRLSGNHKQSCASCHKQEYSFTDGKDLSVGAMGKKAKRNSMALINLDWQNRFFWDGRASSLEELVHFPTVNPLEMNADTNEIVKTLKQDTAYKTLFLQAFGTDTITFKLVSRAISQFVRTITSYASPFELIYKDHIVNGPEVYSASDIDFLFELFMPGNENKYGHDPHLSHLIKQISPDTNVILAFFRCVSCHYNSMLDFNLKLTLDSNKVFHMHVFYSDSTEQSIDLIREQMKTQYKSNGLDTTGNDKGLYEFTGKEEDKYLFKVPTLKNLVFTAPYMHDGRFKTLEEVVEHYNSGIMANPQLDTLLMDSDKKPIRFHLNEDEKKELVGLLKLLTDSTIVKDPRFSAP